MRLEWRTSPDGDLRVGGEFSDTLLVTEVMIQEKRSCLQDLFMTEDALFDLSILGEIASGPHHISHQVVLGNPLIFHIAYAPAQS